MSNKRKKQVRCTLCNPFSWLGNSLQKLSARDKKLKEKMKQEIKES